MVRGRTPRQSRTVQRSPDIDDNASPEKEALGSHKAVSSGPSPVAIDLGAYTIRISIDGVTTRCPNAIVRQSQRRGTSAAVLVGPQIHSQCNNFGSLSIRQPMDRGLVVDWAAQKAILDAAVVYALARSAAKLANGGEKAKDTRLLEGRIVILTEAYLNLPDLQTAMDLLLIEEYGAASIWRCAPAYVIPYAPSLFISKASLGPGRKRTRPECVLVVDLGHGASHVVPLIGEDVIWKAVRRHVISQRILTNLLKESISFRQWDMMDETWLINHIKERCCFVAARSGRRGEDVDVKGHTTPSDWSYAALLEMCQETARRSNPIVQEYVLPDYANSSSKSKYGYIRHGPGALSEKVEGLDDFIADLKQLQNGHSTGGIYTNGAGGDDDDDVDDDDDDGSDDDFDGKDANSESSSNGDPHRPKKKAKVIKSATKGKERNQKKAEDDDEDAEQVLILERERFQVPEVMFDPAIASLDHAPLHDVILDSIEACQSDAQGPLWANIVLVGGGAKMRGMKRRLEEELRALAPIDVPVNIFTTEDPSMATIDGAQALLASTPGSSLFKVLESRLQSSKTYNYVAACRTFGSWSSSSTTSS